jgi:hypothetical protein
MSRQSVTPDESYKIIVEDSSSDELSLTPSGDSEPVESSPPLDTEEAFLGTKDMISEKREEFENWRKKMADQEKKDDEEFKKQPRLSVSETRPVTDSKKPMIIAQRSQPIVLGFLESNALISYSESKHYKEVYKKYLALSLKQKMEIVLEKLRLMYVNFRKEHPEALVCLLMRATEIRPAAKDLSVESQWLTEDEKDKVVDHFLNFTIGKPNLLLIPGSIAYRQKDSKESFERAYVFQNGEMVGFQGKQYFRDSRVKNPGDDEMGCLIEFTQDGIPTQLLIDIGDNFEKNKEFKGEPYLHVALTNGEPQCFGRFRGVINAYCDSLSPSYVNYPMNLGYGYRCPLVIEKFRLFKLTPDMSRNLLEAMVGKDDKEIVFVETSYDEYYGPPEEEVFLFSDQRSFDILKLVEEKLEKTGPKKRKNFYEFLAYFHLSYSDYFNEVLGISPRALEKLEFDLREGLSCRNTDESGEPIFSLRPLTMEITHVMLAIARLLRYLEEGHYEDNQKAKEFLLKFIGKLSDLLNRRIRYPNGVKVSQEVADRDYKKFITKSLTSFFSTDAQCRKSKEYQQEKLKKFKKSLEKDGATFHTSQVSKDSGEIVCLP